MANRGTEAGQQEPVRRSYITARGSVLFAMLSLLVLTIAIPTQQLIDQNNRLNSLRAQITDNKALIKQLQQEVDRWADPAYVKAQARERLHYVMPGEVGYVVLEAEQAPVVQMLVQPESTEPWYRLMWQSMTLAAGSAD